MNKEIIIFHLNDTHARIFTDNDNGLSIGFDQITKVINLSLLENNNTLFFHGGDLIHGTPSINISKGMNLIEVLNSMPLNALVLGNHEWNFGEEQLLTFTKKLNSYVLCANIVDKCTNDLLFLPYIIYDIDVNQNDYISAHVNNSKNDNIKIGVFGLTTPEAAYKTHPDNVKNVNFLNPLITAKSIVNLLKNNCDIIIALTHLGIDKSSEFTSELLANTVNDIDLIIDSHSHSILEHGLRVNNTLIVQAGAHNHYLGKVIITIDHKKIINMQASLLNEAQIDHIIHTPDPIISNKLNNINNETKQILEKPIAYCNHTLPGERELVRKQETAIGNFTADAFKWFTKADIAICNGGDIRSSLLKGNISYKDILAIFPFQNYINTYRITGQLIKELLEHSIEFMPAAFGGFLSVSSNILFKFNSNLPPKNRIQQIYINNKILNNNDEYILACSSFLAAGGDEYTMLKNIQEVQKFDTVENIIIQYILQNNIDFKSIAINRSLNLFNN